MGNPLNPLLTAPIRRAANPLLSPRPSHPSGDPIGARVLRRKPSTIGKKTHRILCAREASAMLEGWHPSEPLAVVTRGQLALSDLIVAAADKIGTPHCIASAWASAPEHIDFLLNAKTTGRFASLALILDRLLASRHPEAVAILRTELGDDRLAITRTKARFALLWNDDARVTITSSADLTRNPGFELHQFDPSDDMFDFLAALARDIFAAHSTPAATMAGITEQFHTITE